MDGCIFCKIVKGEIPSFKIYEDENYFGFLDVFPRVKGHALVIPKKHYRWTYDVPDFGGYWEVARKIAISEQKDLGATFVSFLTMGEAVPHAHIHILPQYGDGIQGITFGKTIQISKEEIAQIATLLRSSQ